MSKFLISVILWFSLINNASSESLEEIKDKESIDEIKKYALSSFSLPLNELLNKKSESELENILSEFGGGIGFGYPLKESTPSSFDGSGNQGRISNNLALSASLSFRPIPNWFLSTSFYKYINENLKAPWNPDFSYTFGYSDWRPYTFGLTYANYGGNRIFPNSAKNETFTDFLGGGFTLDWKFTVPRFIENIFIVHESGGIGGSLAYSLTPKYFQLDTLETKNWKNSFKVSLKYTIYEWFYINATFFYYPFPDQQQPWDPDFTYGFGFFDWHPNTISIQYNNYSGNRYPWNKRSGSGGFENGGLSLSFSL